MFVPHNELRPIKIFGVVLIIFTFVGTLFFFSPASPGFFFGFFEEMSKSRGALYFLLGTLVFYFLTGLGVVLQKKWGYLLFKLFLYLLFLAFPIGTIISYMTLSYMKRHQIKRYFGFATP
jgi:hypothetical protein